MFVVLIDTVRRVLEIYLFIEVVAYIDVKLDCGYPEVYLIFWQPCFNAWEGQNFRNTFNIMHSSITTTPSTIYIINTKKHCFVASTSEVTVTMDVHCSTGRASLPPDYGASGKLSYRDQIKAELAQVKSLLHTPQSEYVVLVLFWQSDCSWVGPGGGRYLRRYLTPFRLEAWEGLIVWLIGQ